ncbi:MAG: DsbE family thiol:disulfide interchange protein [Hyphomicrobiaceae bacterium]
MTGKVEEAEKSNRRYWLLIPVVLFAVVAGMFAYSLQHAKPNLVPSVLIGKPVPNTAFPSLDGLIRAGSQVAGFSNTDVATGDVILVNFWASWCAPCVAEHPQLLKLAKEHGVKLYGINYKDAKADALKFLNTLGNPYSVVGTDESGRAAIEWGVYGMPETFVINGEGQIVYKHVGPIMPNDLANKILPVIKSAKAGS